MEEKKEKDKVVKVIMYIIFSTLAILGGFTFIAMGVYLSPVIVEHMIENGRPAIGLFEILFNLGILGGATFLINSGLKETLGDKYK